MVVNIAVLGLVVNNKFWQLINEDLLYVIVVIYVIISWVLSLIRADLTSCSNYFLLEITSVIEIDTPGGKRNLKTNKRVQQITFKQDIKRFISCLHHNTFRAFELVIGVYIYKFSNSSIELLKTVTNLNSNSNRKTFTTEKEIDNCVVKNLKPGIRK